MMKRDLKSRKVQQRRQDRSVDNGLKIGNTVEGIRILLRVQKIYFLPLDDRS